MISCDMTSIHRISIDSDLFFKILVRPDLVLASCDRRRPSEDLFYNFKTVYDTVTKITQNNLTHYFQHLDIT